MFTVIVCDEHIIKDCYQKYHIFFKPFLNSDNFSFCEWNHKGDTLEEASKEVTVIFNNNSGGHAAANGKSLKKLLGLAFEELGPQQIDLF